MKWKSIVGGAVLSFALAAPAYATPVGQFTLSDISSGVSVGLTFIDWQPAGGGTGTFQIGGSTTLTYTGGTLSAGETGVVKDLIQPVSFPVADFFTFDQDPLLSFDLAGLGPGVSNTDCATLTNGQSCSPFVGSPFILTKVGTQSIVSLAGFGTATDGTGTSNWIGSWSTQISTMTPAQIQAFFGCVPGQGVTSCTAFGTTKAISSTYSGEFNATVPEPATLAIFGLGLLGTGYRARRRRQN